MAIDARPVRPSKRGQSLAMAGKKKFFVILLGEVEEDSYIFQPFITTQFLLRNLGAAQITLARFYRIATTLALMTVAVNQLALLDPPHPVTLAT